MVYTITAPLAGPGAARATAGKRPPHNTRSATTVAAPKPAASAANGTRTGRLSCATLT